MEAPVLNSLMDQCPWFRKEALTAYSLRNAFSERDTAYEAMMCVAKASIDIIRCAKDYQQLIVFPVVAIDSPLVRCSLRGGGEILCEEVTSGEVFFKYGLEEPFRTCIAVVTLEKLADYVGEAWKVARYVRGQLDSAETKLWEGKFSSPYPEDLWRLSEREHDRPSGV